MAEQQIEALPQEMRAWCEKHLGAAGATATQQSGGANNKVFLWESSSSRAIVKHYSPINSSKTDRLLAETEFLSFANKVAPEFVPNLLQSDPDARIVAMEYLEGTGFKASYLPSKEVVRRAADFLAALNAHDTNARQKISSQAADGFMSLSEHLNDLENRIDTLECNHIPGRFTDQTVSLISRVKERWQIVSKNVETSISAGRCTNTLPSENCILSPSDFGFHNAISCQEGLKFHDFEFSGWDDPTKTVVDFFLQPSIRVPPKYLNIMENTVASAIPMDILRPRAHALAAILHLKWVTIVLAVLKPKRLDTMLAVDVSKSVETLIQERLARAGELLSEGVPIGLS